MTTTARLARGALPCLLTRRSLALSLHIGRSLRLNRLPLTNFRLSRLLRHFRLRRRSLVGILLTLYGIRTSRKTASGTTGARSLLGRLPGIARDLGSLFGLVHDFLLLGLKWAPRRRLGS